MVTIRNRDQALAIAATAGAANLKSGMLVTLTAGTSVGDNPKCVKAVIADLTDATKQLGVVYYEDPDSLAVDFDVDTTTMGLTAQSKTIPNGAQVVVFYAGTIVLAYHKSDLAADLDPATVREPSAIAFDVDTNFPALYTTGQTDGRSIVKGKILRIDGPEVTMKIELGA